MNLLKPIFIEVGLFLTNISTSTIPGTDISSASIFCVDLKLTSHACLE